MTQTTVHLVGAGPGDPDLLTVKAARLLAAADVVVHDRLIDPRVLALAAKAELIDVGKRPGFSSTQADINSLLVSLGSATDVLSPQADSGVGRVIVRLKGGDPFVFGRGGEEAEALDAAGVRYEVVSGVSSSVAGPASAGIPVTHRGLSSSFTVVAGHREGHDDTNWKALAAQGNTIVVLMGVEHRARIAAELLASGMAASTPVAAIERATWESQRTVRATLGELARLDVVSPATLVIGAVAALQLTQLLPFTAASLTY
jgi:uroporphyrin-III C-methyltransferase